MDGPEQRFDILYLNFIDVYLRELQNEVRRIYGTSRSQGFTNEPRRHTERGGWDRDRILKLFKETCDKK
jgi:hypothetical protein